MTYQQGKVIRLQQWLAEHPELKFEHSHGYSDSMNDKPLLEYVDSATVVNPNDELKTLALKQGWEICHWER
ncbi:hypothetical protein D3C79_1082160 [compost metagenome]